MTRRRQHPYPLIIDKEASSPPPTSPATSLDPSPDELVAQLIATSATATEPLPLPEFDPDDYDPLWDEYLYQIEDQDIIEDRYLLDDEEGGEDLEEP